MNLNPVKTLNTVTPFASAILSASVLVTMVLTRAAFLGSVPFSFLLVMM